MPGNFTPSHGLRARLAALLGVGPAGWLKQSARLIAAAERCATTNPQAAASLYAQAIELLSEGAGSDSKRRSLLATALLSRGKVQEFAGDAEAAAATYLQARRQQFPLPLPALIFLTRELARRGDHQQEATEAYLDLLQQFREKEKPGPVADVYRALEQLTDAEEDRPARLEVAEELCPSFVQADPSLPWPHYALGVRRCHRGEYREALPYLETARSRGSTRPLLSYYLAFTRAMLLRSEGHVPEAVSALREAAEAAPEYAVAHYQLGLALLDLRHLSAESESEAAAAVADAIACFQQAASLESENAGYARELGHVRMLAGDPAGAVEALRAAVELAPQHAPYRLELSLALRAAGSVAEAREQARAAAARDPALIGARQLAGALALAADDCEEAAREFAAVVEAAPEDEQARTELGHALYSLGRFEEALAAFEPICRLVPAAAFQVARCYALTGRFAEAAERLEALLAICPEEAGYWHALGLAQAHLDRLEEAVQAFAQAARRDPRRAGTHLQWGHALSKLGRPAEAREAYQRALALAPDDLSVLTHAGRVAALLGDDETAAMHLGRVVLLGGAPAPVRRLLATVHERQGNAAAAAAIWEREVQEAPAEALAHRRLGVLRCRLGEVAAAVDSLAQARTHGDDSAEWRYYSGLAAARGGAWAEALGHWGYLLARRPNDTGLRHAVASARYLLGKQCLEQGLLREAIEAWTACLQSGPDEAELREDLAKLHLRAALAALTGGDEGGAEAEGERGLALLPHNASLHYVRAVCRLAGGDWRAYLTEARGAVAELDPCLRPHAEYHLALAWLATGDAAPAHRHLAQAIAIPYREAEARLALALLYASRGHWDEARRALPSPGDEAEARLEGDLCRARDSLLAVCLLNAGRAEEAAQFLSSRLAAQDRPEWRFHLGLAQARMGLLEEAAATFLAALRNEPEEPRARQAAKDLLQRAAAQRMSDGNWIAAARPLDALAELAPDDPEVQELRDCFTQAGPLVHLLSGRREEAAEGWEAVRRSTSSRGAATHSLSLLYTSWALALERKGRAGEALWRKAIGNHVLLSYDDAFWQEWKRRREAPSPIPETAFTEARAWWRGGLRSHLQECAATRPEDESRLAALERTLWIEETTAEALAELAKATGPQGGEAAAAESEPDRSHPAHQLPFCGPIMLSHLGLDREARQLAKSADQLPNGGALTGALARLALPFVDTNAEVLRLCLSPWSQAFALAAARQYEKLFTVLASGRPADDRQWTQLMLLAGFEHGRQLVAALPPLPEAPDRAQQRRHLDRVRQALAVLARAVPQRGAIPELGDQLCEQVESCVIGTAEALQRAAEARASEGRRSEQLVSLSDAIAVLHEGLGLVHRGGIASALAASYLARARAHRLADQTQVGLSRAIADGEEALKVAPERAQYRKEAAASYNARGKMIHEGIISSSRAELEAACRDVARAVELDPDEPSYRSNLAAILAALEQA